MRELDSTELAVVSGGWNHLPDPGQDPLQDPLSDPRGFIAPGFDEGEDGDPTVSAGAEGGSNGVDGWHVKLSLNTNDDGKPDLDITKNSDGDWSVSYTTNSGATVTLTNQAPAGPTTPGAPSAPSGDGLFASINVDF